MMAETLKRTVRAVSPEIDLARRPSTWMAAIILMALAMGPTSAAPTRYAYDDLNRLIRVERADGVVVTYTYDALGNRLSRRVVHDQDFDDSPDAIDCAPADPGAFAVPSEVADLMFDADKITLRWTSAAPAAGPGTVHDVPRGELGTWPIGGGMGETCIASGVSTSTAQDAIAPSAGQGFWYLVRGRNACGSGTYGSAAGGAPRTTGACP